MHTLFAQGDVLLERVVTTQPTGKVIKPDAFGRTVLAEGEKSGHRHAIEDQVTFFRDERLATDVPSGLYIGHLTVDGETARLTHDEHDAIVLPRGTYRVRRQRQLEPQDAVPVVD